MRFLSLFLRSLLLFCLFSCVSSLTNTTRVYPVGSLLWSGLVHRHGARTPVFDISPVFAPQFAALFGPQIAQGDLTEVGRQQHMANGAALRKRFQSEGIWNSSLTIGENAKIARYRSTSVDRVLISAESLLSSLFSPTDSSPVALFAPVPSVKVDYDRLLNGILTCPIGVIMGNIADTQLADLAQHYLGPINDETSIFRQIIASLQYTYDPNAPVQYWFIVIADNLLSAIANQLEIPTFASQHVYLLHYVYGQYYTQRFGSHGYEGTNLMWQFQRIMNTIVQAQAQAEDLSSFAVKLHLYSGHDTTVGPLMGALGLLDYQVGQDPYPSYPIFATTLGFELRQLDTQYLVNLLLLIPQYNLTTQSWSSDPKPIPIRCPTATQLAQLAAGQTNFKIQDFPLTTQCSFDAFTATVQLQLPGVDLNADNVDMDSITYEPNNPCCILSDDQLATCSQPGAAQKISYCNSFQTFCTQPGSSNPPPAPQKSGDTDLSPYRILIGSLGASTLVLLLSSIYLFRRWRQAEERSNGTISLNSPLIE